MIIRLATAKDAGQLLDIYRPFVTETIVSFELTEPSLANFAERIKTVLQTAPWLVCESKEGIIAGYAYASVHRSRQAYSWSRETSVYVHPDFRKRKIASGLYTSLLALLKAQGFQNALAGITLPNEASVTFHEKMGFRPVGVYHKVGYKLGIWCDVGWWELFLGAKGEAPPKRLSLAELQDSLDWQKSINMGLSKLKAD